ncbi:MAG TPA: DUF192 domain-containing protein [Thermoanaerobaculia bacterium]|nr:DUF192 domain-containing protein [Thermoanaerobaculia bacterium]
MERLRVARSFRDRFLGLMGRRDLSSSFIVFPNCRSIHTCFMMGPIDIAFLDRDGRVVTQHEAVHPWRLVFGTRASSAALEVPAGYLRSNGIKPGDVIVCQ